MSLSEHLHANCPRTLKRMDLDARRGVFSWSWPIRGVRSKRYMSGLLGREIMGSDKITEILTEVEQKLAGEADE